MYASMRVSCRAFSQLLEDPAEAAAHDFGEVLRTQFLNVVVDTVDSLPDVFEPEYITVQSFESANSNDIHFQRLLCVCQRLRGRPQLRDFGEELSDLDDSDWGFIVPLSNCALRNSSSTFSTSSRRFLKRSST